LKKEREATEALAVKCGLTQNDLGKIFQAKKNLAAFQPTNRMERMAKRALESLLSSKPSKREGGRPGRILAAERQELRQRADEMLAAGRTRNEIVVEFAEEYGLRLSYVRRIGGGVSRSVALGENLAAGPIPVELAIGLLYPATAAVVSVVDAVEQGTIFFGASNTDEK
jgi:hypothetical protein